MFQWDQKPLGFGVIVNHPLRRHLLGLRLGLPHCTPYNVLTLYITYHRQFPRYLGSIHHWKQEYPPPTSLTQSDLSMDLVVVVAPNLQFVGRALGLSENPWGWETLRELCTSPPTERVMTTGCWLDCVRNPHLPTSSCEKSLLP